MLNLSRNTTIELGAAVAVVITVAGGVWWFAQQMGTVQSAIREVAQTLAQRDRDLETRFADVNKRLADSEAKFEDYYSLTKASEQALRTAIENPTLRVPDPRDPRTIIQVRREP